MKAISGELPVGPGWSYEVKWDGMRAIVVVEDERVRLWSANGNEATVSFPEIAGLGAALGVGDAILDGELVALDAKGRPDFGRIQQRMHIASARQAAERATQVPVVLMLFDLLCLDGHRLDDLPWSQRRALLERLVPPGAHWQVPPASDDGEALLDAADANGLEGVVAKRVDSPYRPGTRTRDWVKVKVRRRQEFVVGGWAPGQGNRANGIGGLLVGYHDVPGDPVLRYGGRVGSGLTQAERRVLTDLFRDLAIDECPFTPPPPRTESVGAHWVRPEVVVEVAYAEWTGEGRLRHPTYCGRRPDKDAADVTNEP